VFAVGSDQKSVIRSDCSDVVLYLLSQLFLLFDVDWRVLFLRLWSLESLRRLFIGVDKGEEIGFSEFGVWQSLKCHNLWVDAFIRPIQPSVKLFSTEVLDRSLDHSLKVSFGLVDILFRLNRLLPGVVSRPEKFMSEGVHLKHFGRF
jgi:hypothetical protein